MKTITLLLVLWCAVVSAAELDSNAYAYIHYCYLGRLRYAFAISTAKYARMRPWNPDEAPNPPVSARRALDLAKARLASIKIPKGYSMRLESVSLKPINRSDPDGKWMYVVSYCCSFGLGSDAPEYMDFVVTMDDELIEPIIDVAKLNF